jgi:hypothetical protein
LILLPPPQKSACRKLDQINPQVTPQVGVVFERAMPMSLHHSCSWGSQSIKANAPMPVSTTAT